jgi:hypothetical protein
VAIACKRQGYVITLDTVDPQSGSRSLRIQAA